MNTDNFIKLTATEPRLSAVFNLDGVFPPPEEQPELWKTLSLILLPDLHATLGNSAQRTHQVLADHLRISIAPVMTPEEWRAQLKRINKDLHALLKAKQEDRSAKRQFEKRTALERLQKKWEPLVEQQTEIVDGVDVWGSHNADAHADALERDIAALSELAVRDQARREVDTRARVPGEVLTTVRGPATINDSTSSKAASLRREFEARWALSADGIKNANETERRNKELQTIAQLADSVGQDIQAGRDEGTNYVEVIDDVLEQVEDIAPEEADLSGLPPPPLPSAGEAGTELSHEATELEALEAKIEASRERVTDQRAVFDERKEQLDARDALRHHPVQRELKALRDMKLKPLDLPDKNDQ